MKAICNQYDLFLSNGTSFKTIYSTCSWASVTLACPTALLNLLLIVTLLRSRERKKPCAVLILNLAITDLLNGLINMPLLYITFRYIAETKDPCGIVTIFMPCVFAVSVESFLTVALVAIERYISLFHPFFYNSKLSSRNVAVCVGVSWLLSILLITPLIVGEKSAKFSGFIFAFGVGGVAVNFYCYLRLLYKAKKIQLQIRNEIARFSSATISSGDRRYFFIGGLIIASMVVCFSMEWSISFLWLVGYTSKSMINSHCWKLNLVMGNSFVNPIITCSFCPTVRRGLLKILSCNSLCKSSA